MPLIALLVAGLALAFEQLVQWRFGPAGLVAFALLTVGVKAKNTTLSSIGAIVLVVLLTNPTGS
ncbi:hypothetical protein [Streptomyces sp. NPDC060194]|uniref:hypothetical protein n=1 Tax=Streptomyces sp. NPDC060194 TaxID=3347069 RepID=UPI00364F8771